MMKRASIPLLIATLSMMVLAQDTGSKAEGEGSSQTTTQYHVFTTGAPVRAFAIQEDIVWCAMDLGLASITMHGEKKTDIKAMGSMPAAGIETIAVDKQNRVWFGGPSGVAVKSQAKITQITSRNGLPNDRVHAIAAASNGGVWVGTDSGAALYQGTSWKVFTEADGLTSNKIQVIAPGAGGAIWFGTDKGIAVYDGGHWTTHTTKNGMSWNDTRALCFDQRKGVMWAAVGDKDVNMFDGQKWNVFMEIQSGITAIMIDSQSRAWFASDNGLIKFNGDDWISDPSQIGAPITRAFQMKCDEKGNLWFATNQGVLYLLNPYPF